MCVRGEKHKAGEEKRKVLAREEGKEEKRGRKKCKEGNEIA